MSDKNPIPEEEPDWDLDPNNPDNQFLGGSKLKGCLFIIGFILIFSLPFIILELFGVDTSGCSRGYNPPTPIHD
jgi:hypothetical protein